MLQVSSPPPTSRVTDLSYCARHRWVAQMSGMNNKHIVFQISDLFDQPPPTD